MLPELLADQISPDVTGVSGWKHFPERADLLLTLAVILIFAWSWGRLVMRGLTWRTFELDRLETMYWSLITGIAMWGTMTLILGLAGWLQRWVFVGAGVVPLVIEVLLRFRMKRTGPSTPTQIVPSVWTGLGYVCAVAVIPFLLAMLLGSLQPPNDFDVKEYHLEGVKEHYLAGRVGFLRHNVYTSFPFLTEMLCLSSMVLRGDWFRGALAGQAVLAAFAPLTALGIFLAARRWIGIPAAWLAVLIHLSCPWIYRISIIAYAEGGLACFLFAGFFAACHVVECHDPRVRARWTLLAGLISGAAAGCKYPGVLTVVLPVGFWLIFREWQLSRVQEDPGSRGQSQLIRTVVLFSLGGLVTFGPWLAKNIYETGNPVYPLVYSVFGGRDWDPESHAKWQAGHPLPLKDIDGLGWILRDTRDRLWDVFFTSDWQSGMYLGLSVAICFAIWRQRAMARMASFRILTMAVCYAVFLFLAWQYLTHRIDRFWVPMLPILSLLAGAGAGELWDTVPALLPERTQSVTAVVRGLVAAPMLATVLFQLGLATSAIGGNNSYLMNMQALQQMVKTPAIALVDHIGLQPGNKVLFVGEAEVFDAEFPYEYNTVFDHSIFEEDCSVQAPEVARGKQELKPAGEIRERWKSRGITHIVVNWSEILRYRTTYQLTDFVHPRVVQQLIALGVIRPITTPGVPLLVPWDKVADEKRREVDKWAPELKVNIPGDGEYLRAIEAFQVAL